MATSYFPNTRLTAPLSLPDPDAALNGSQRAAFYSLSLYLFLMMSRMPEIIAQRFGTSFYQVFIVSIICGLLFLTGADFRRFASNRLTAFMIALHLLYLLSIPFSYWKSGSVEHLKTVGRYLPLFFFLAALIHTEKQLRKIFVIMAAAMLVVLIFTLSAPVLETEDDRLALDGSRFANSNEIAFYLLIGLPFWLYVTASKRFPAVIRVLAGLEIGVSLYQCLRTGSRGGLITIFVIGVVIFLASSMANKMKLMILIVGMSVLAMPLLPERVRERFSSLTDSTKDASAADSAESRFELLLESLRITAKHPILGVGFGVYPEAAAAISSQAGQRKRWQVSHNAFTEVSSETGIPALFMFLGTIFYSLQTILRARRMAATIPEMADLALMSSCIALVLLVYLINCFFANIASELFYYMVCGFVLAAGAIVADRYHNLMRAHHAAASNNTESLPVLNPGPSRTQKDPQGKFRPSGTARPPVAPTGGSDQYGDVPWARNPRRTSPGH